MGITEILTIIFVFCKLFGVIDWSWFIVFAPEMIAIVFYVVIIFALIRAAAKAEIAERKFFEKFGKF